MFDINEYCSRKKNDKGGLKIEKKGELLDKSDTRKDTGYKPNMARMKQKF